MQIKLITTLIVSIIATISTALLRFAPKKSYFNRVGEENGMYEATFSRGPGQNSRLMRKVPLPKFGGRRDHITSFLTSASSIFRTCIGRNWPTADLLETVEDLMVEHSAAESKRGDTLATQGVLNNLNHEEA